MSAMGQKSPSSRVAIYDRSYTDSGRHVEQPLAAGRLDEAPLSLDGNHIVELGHRRGILKNTKDNAEYYDVMSASVEYQGAIRQFMVDSGCPLDLL